MHRGLALLLVGLTSSGRPPSPPVLIDRPEPFPPGPVRILSQTRWLVLAPIGGRIESARPIGGRLPDVHIDWPALPLEAPQRGRLGLLEGDYDPATNRIRQPRYTFLSMPEALRLSPELAQRLAEKDALFGRSYLVASPRELLALGVLPGPRALDSLLKQLVADPTDRMPAEVVGREPPPVRPELLLGLVVIHRRHPELVAEHIARVQAKVERALSRMSDEQRLAHAAELAYVLWEVLGDRARALDVLGRGMERIPIEHDWNDEGIQALGLPPALVFAHLGRTGGHSERDRAVLRRYLLYPVARDLMLSDHLPLPAAFHGLPRLDPAWTSLARRDPDEAQFRAIVGQFDAWPRVGATRIAAQAVAWVDRMPMPGGPRPPDPRGVSLTLYVLNESSEAQAVTVGQPRFSWKGGALLPVPLRTAAPPVPARSAVVVALGALGDQVLEPGAPFTVELPVQSGGETHTFSLKGTVQVSH